MAEEKFISTYNHTYVAKRLLSNNAVEEKHYSLDTKGESSSLHWTLNGSLLCTSKVTDLL
ncbi:hypothetical protein KGM_213767 [Danaus plexippus plexippus]|uniref:Uncharacterized protein n=1 Tax=Danaus plexippus plexippus TaxID=278856 RepID=A0A212F2Z9_DANPL|nr:hypothetical protein KGM_213767 [Danaus plexippus plexippus]